MNLLPNFRFFKLKNLVFISLLLNHKKLKRHTKFKYYFKVDKIKNFLNVAFKKKFFLVFWKMRK